MATADDERYMDETTRRLARKRQLARLLEEQSMKFNLPNPNARASWTNVGSSLAEALVGRLKGEEADKEGKQYQQEQDDALKAAMERARGLPEREQMGPHESLMNPPEQMGPPEPPAPEQMGPPSPVDLGSIEVTGKREGPPMMPQLGNGPAPTGPSLVPKPVDLSDPAAVAEQKAGLRPGLLNTFKALERSPVGSVSSKGASGPYQVMPENVAAYSKQEGRQLDPNDPADSALMASKVAADAKRRYPDNERAQVAYYNGGWRAGDAVAGGKTTTNPETDKYLAHYDKINQGPPAPDATMLAANAPSPIPPMPAPGPTPPPTLAGPAVPGAVPPPVKVEAGGGPTDEQWNAMAATPSPAGTPYPAPAPPAAPPPLVPQPPAAAVTPTPLQGSAPKMPMLPAQPSQLSTVQGMMEMVSSLPPGAMKSRMLDMVMKEAVEEPGKIRKLEQEAAIHRQTSLDTRYGVDERERAAAASNANALKIAEMKAAAARDNVNKQFSGLDTDLAPVSYNPKSGKLERPDGKPPLGAVMPLGAVQKEGAAARGIENASKNASELLKMVEDNPGAFGGWKSVGVDAAGILGKAARSQAVKASYTEDERIARTTVANKGAEILHQLYGAALTKGEEKRALEFAYEMGDDPEVIATKIKGMMGILQSKGETVSPQGKAAAGTGKKNVTVDW